MYKRQFQYHIDNTWTYENPTAYYPRPSANGNSKNKQIQTKYFVEESGEFRSGEEGVFNGNQCIDVYKRQGIYSGRKISGNAFAGRVFEGAAAKG